MSIVTGIMVNLNQMTKNRNVLFEYHLAAEQLDQLKVCRPYSRLLTGIPILAVFHLRWKSTKTSLHLCS